MLVFQAFASLFVDSGFCAALIQKKSPTETDYCTVFYFNLGISIAIYGILWACAPLIADTLRRPATDKPVEGDVPVVYHQRHRPCADQPHDEADDDGACGDSQFAGACRVGSRGHLACRGSATAHGQSCGRPLCSPPSNRSSCGRQQAGFRARGSAWRRCGRCFPLAAE